MMRKISSEFASSLVLLLLLLSSAADSFTPPMMMSSSTSRPGSISNSAMSTKYNSKPERKFTSSLRAVEVRNEIENNNKQEYGADNMEDNSLSRFHTSESHGGGGGGGGSSSKNSISATPPLSSTKTTASMNFANFADDETFAESSEEEIPPVAAPPAVPPPTQVLHQQNSHHAHQIFAEDVQMQAQAVGQVVSAWVKKAEVMAPMTKEVQSSPMGSVAASGITVVAWMLAASSLKHGAPLDSLSWALAGGCSASLLSTSPGPVGSFLRAVGTVSSEATALLQEKLQANDNDDKTLAAKPLVQELSHAMKGAKESAISWINEQQQQDDHGSNHDKIPSKVNGGETTSSAAERPGAAASSSSDDASSAHQPTEATARVLMAAAMAPEEHEQQRGPKVSKNFAFDPAPVVRSANDPVVKTTTTTTTIKSKDTAPVSLSITTEPDHDVSIVKEVEEPIVEETASTMPTETVPAKPEVEVVIVKDDMLPIAADLGEPVITYYDEFAVRPKPKKASTTVEQAEKVPLDHNKSEPMNAPSTVTTQATVSQPKDMSEQSTSSPRKSVTAAFDATCASCLKSASTTSFEPRDKPNDIFPMSDGDHAEDSSTISQNKPKRTARKDITSAYASTAASTLKNAREETYSVQSNTPAAVGIIPDESPVSKDTRTVVDTIVEVPSVNDSAETIIVESNQNEPSADEKARTFVMGPGQEDEVPPPVAFEPRDVTATFAATSAASLRKSVKLSADKATVVVTQDDTIVTVKQDDVPKRSATAAFDASVASALKSARPEKISAKSTTTTPEANAIESQDKPSVWQEMLTFVETVNAPSVDVVSNGKTTNFDFSDAIESQGKPSVWQEMLTFDETVNAPSVDVVSNAKTTNFDFSDASKPISDEKARTFVVGEAQHDDGRPAFVPGEGMPKTTRPRSVTAAFASSTAAALKNEKTQRNDKQRSTMPVSVTAAVAASTAAALKSEKLQRNGVQRSPARTSLTAAVAASTAAALKNEKRQRNDVPKSTTPMSATAAVAASTAAALESEKLQRYGTQRSPAGVSVTAAVAASTAASLKNEKPQRNGVPKRTTPMSATAAVAASTAAALKSEKPQRNGKHKRSKTLSNLSDEDASEAKKPISSMTWLADDQLQAHVESTSERKSTLRDNDSIQAGANKGPKSTADTDSSPHISKPATQTADKQPAKATLSWEDEFSRAERAYKETKATQELISRLNKLQGEKELKFRQERSSSAPKPVLAGLERNTNESSSAADSTMMLERPRFKRPIAYARKARRSKMRLKMERDDGSGSNNDKKNDSSKFLYRLTRKEGPPPTKSSLSTDFSYLSMEGTSDDYLAAPPPLLRRPRRLRRRRRKEGAHVPEEQPKGTVDAKGEESATEQGQQPELEQKKQPSTVDKEPQEEEEDESTAMSLEQATAVSEFVKSERRRLADQGISPEETKLKVEQAVRLLVFLVLCQAGQQDVSMENKTHLSLVEKLFIAYNSHRRPAAPHGHGGNAHHGV